MRHFVICVGLILIGIATVEPIHAEPMAAEAEGKIVKIVPAEKEIYVLAAGEKLEFYFSPETKVTLRTVQSDFSALRIGQRVKVISRKVGKRLDPLIVEVLE